MMINNVVGGGGGGEIAFICAHAKKYDLGRRRERARLTFCTYTLTLKGNSENVLLVSRSIYQDAYLISRKRGPLGQYGTSCP